MMTARIPFLLPSAFLLLPLLASAAPVISGGAYSPVFPVPGEPVRVTAEITGATEATLLWRLDGAASFTPAAMSAAGTTWSGTIPPQAAGATVEFSVQAIGGGTATWPAAGRNALLRVEPAAVPSAWAPGAVPVWRILTTATASMQMSVGEVPCTVIIRDATGTSVRQACGLVEKETSPKTFTLSFPPAEPWQGRASVTLSADRPHSQALGAAIFRRAGLPAAAVDTVEVRLNGVNAAAAGAPSYGRFGLREPLDAAWAARQFPAFPAGNLYLMNDSGPGTHGGLGVKNPATAANYGDTFFKTAGPAPDDFADIIALTSALSNAPQATYAQDIGQKADLPQWLRYLALDSLLGNGEPGLQTGRGTDVALYHLPSSDRILLVPGGTRSLLGLGGAADTATRSLFSSGATPGLDRVMNHPGILPFYTAGAQALLNTVFTSQTLDPLITSVMNGWVPAAEINTVKQFVANRRTAALAELVSSYGPVTVTGEAASVESMATTATGTLTLSGTFPVAETGSVLVNGVAAEANFRNGTWTFTASAANGTLQRGTNSFMVEFFSAPGGTGTVLRRLTATGLYSGGGTTVTTVTAPAITTDTLVASGGNPPTAAPANSGPWRYLAEGPPAGWQNEEFDDTTWTEGTPHFGFGESDQRTTLPTPAGRATWYFRRTFNVDAAALPLYTAVTLRMVYDDGAIVYLNGQEVTRKNLPATGVTDASPASAKRPNASENSFESIPLTAFLSKLHAGVNTLAVEVHNFPESDNDLSFDAEITGTRPVTDGVRWTAAASPYLVTANLTIPATTKLTVEPGTSIFVSPGRQIIAKGPLRILGTPYARVRLSHVPGATPVDDAALPGTQIGPPKWKGILIQDNLSPDNLISYADFINAQADTNPAASIGLQRAACVIDHCTFAGSKFHAIRGENMSITVQDCVFHNSYLPGENPLTLGLDNKSEYIQLSGQPLSNAGYKGRWPIGGVIRIYRNTFGALPGHNDLLDVISGTAGVTPILDCQDNVFLGPTGDESIDMDGDAYVAGNFFSNVKKDAYTEDKGYANALSSNEGDAETTVVMARNTFTRVDHGVNIKNATAAIFEHNTVACQNQDYLFKSGTFSQAVKTSAVNFTVPEDAADPGDGAYVAYNILSQGADPAGPYPRILSWADTGGGSSFITKVEMTSNFIDPGIQDPVIGVKHPQNVLDPIWQGVTGDPAFRNIAVDDYTLREDSPARGTAPHGLDYGATIPKGCYLGNLPAIVTADTTANILVGGPGIFSFKWRLDGGAWSAPVAISPLGYPRTGPTVRTANVPLSALTTGPHTFEAVGMDFAGNWTPDGEAARATWTVDTTTPLLLLNEVRTGAGGGVELFNAGSTSLSLAGWTLTDTTSSPGRYALSGELAPGAWLTLPASQTGISLPQAGGAAYLYQNGVQRDVIAFGPQSPAYSLGRTGRERQWSAGTPTPNAANISVKGGTADAVRFNEWVTGNSGWLELVNTGNLPVALDGLRLTTNPAGAPSAYVFPANSLLAPGGYLTLSAPGQLPFTLEARDGVLALLGSTGVIDSVPLSTTAPGTSQGRTADGLIVTFPSPTPGAANNGGTPVTFAAWTALYGVAADADTDRDGLPALVEYALGTSPLDNRDGASLPVVTREADGALRFQFNLPGDAVSFGRADTVLSVEATANPATGPWNVVANRSGAGAWTGSATVTTGQPEGGFVPVSVRVVPPAGGGLFLRLKVGTL